MTLERPSLRLAVSLPGAWRVVPRDEWPTDLVRRNQAHESAAELSEQVPDLVATTFVAVAADATDADRIHAGDVAAADYLLAAGLTVSTIPLAAVPVGLVERTSPLTARRHIVLGDALDAFFDVGTYVRARPEHGVAALLTISTPNLAQGSEIIDGFGAIADSIRYEATSL